MPDIPEGVSAIGETGARSPVDSSSVKKKRHRGDVIADPSKGRRVDPNLPPPGTMRNRVDIIEMPIENARSTRYVAEYQSCDGNSYSFRTHNSRGEADPRRETLCLFLAIREITLGGPALPVFDAFKLKIDDMDGKQVFPVLDITEITPDGVPFTLGE